MTEASAARAYASPAGERPRVSAASFRNLTARLKKVADAGPIPDMVPIVAAEQMSAQPATGFAPPASPEDSVAQPHADPAPKPKTLRRILKNQPGDPFRRQAAHFDLPDFVPLEPVAAAAPAMAPVQDAAPAVQPPSFEPEPAPASLAVSEPAVAEHAVEATSAPTMFEAAAEAVFEPAPQPEPDPVIAFESAIESASEPAPEPEPEPELEIIAEALSPVEAEPVIQSAPELPAIEPEPAPELAAEALVEAAVEQGPDVTAAPFTAEVEPEAAAEPAPPPSATAATQADPHDAHGHPPQGHHRPTVADSAIDAARKEHLSRKEALELEIVWRSLLATPTIEERAVFVREVAEAMAGLGNDLPAPPPEHDLSTIAPAAPETLAAEAGPTPMEPYEDRPAPAAPLPPTPEQQNDNAEVARSLLDMMAAGSTSGLPHERALAADTLLRLVPKLDIKPLIMMAQRLAKADNPPAMLVAKLIRDSRVEVAGPLLEDCPQITDKDLETVVAEGSAAKLRMLARRRHLTGAISDALIKTRDPSVLLTLVRNMDAAISQEGFNALIHAAEDEKELLAPLCTRPDLPAPLAFELFWAAPPQLRRFILSRFLTDSETLTKILKITLSTNDTQESGDGDSGSHHMMIEALERAARGKLEIAADELAQALQITPATAMRVLCDAEGEPMMVLLKVAGYPRQALSGLMKRFRDADLPLLSSGRDLEELQSIFDTLSFNKARILLTYWDWAQRKTGPYAPLH